VLVRKATGDKVLDRLKDFTGTGTVLQTSLSKDNEEELRKVFDKASDAAAPPRAEKSRAVSRDRAEGGDPSPNVAPSASSGFAIRSHTPTCEQPVPLHA